MTIILYDLVYADGRTFSPHCWRTRFALAHKGLEAETVPCTLTDKETIAFADSKALPVIADGEAVVADSWAIACYLEDAYPDRPSLFGGNEVGRGACGFINAWVATQLLPAMMRVLAPDILGCLCDEDRAYFQQTREARLGASFAALTADRPHHLAALRALLAPVTQALEGRPFLCGGGDDGPAYGDYILGAAFQWARCASTAPIITPEDGALYAWRERMLDAFGGMARSVPARADV